MSKFKLHSNGYAGEYWNGTKYQPIPRNGHYFTDCPHEAKTLLGCQGISLADGPDPRVVEEAPAPASTEEKPPASEKPASKPASPKPANKPASKPASKPAQK